jgi:hypothetical protein
MRVVFSVWYTKHDVSADEVDYSEYLGPKWKEELKAHGKRAPTVISNHSALYDDVI